MLIMILLLLLLLLLLFTLFMKTKLSVTVALIVNILKFTCGRMTKDTTSFYQDKNF